MPTLYSAHDVKTRNEKHICNHIDMHTHTHKHIRIVIISTVV